MPTATVLPARAGAHVRLALRAVHPAGHRRTPDTSGARGRRDRRGGPLHHRPEHPGAAPGRADCPSATPAGRERAAAAPTGHLSPAWLRADPTGQFGLFSPDTPPTA